MDDDRVYKLADRGKVATDQTTMLILARRSSGEEVGGLDCDVGPDPDGIVGSAGDGDEARFGADRMPASGVPASGRASDGCDAMGKRTLRDTGANHELGDDAAVSNGTTPAMTASQGPLDPRVQLHRQHTGPAGGREAGTDQTAMMLLTRGSSEGVDGLTVNCGTVPEPGGTVGSAEDGAECPVRHRSNARLWCAGTGDRAHRG